MFTIEEMAEIRRILANLQLRALDAGPLPWLAGPRNEVLLIRYLREVRFLRDSPAENGPAPSSENAWDVIADAIAEHATEVFGRHHRECRRCTEDTLCDAGGELRLVMIDANDGTDSDGSDVDTSAAWATLRGGGA